MEAYNAGQRIFAESRPQELASKVPQMPTDVKWHFIGHLQTNKLKLVLPYVDLVQSVDSLHLLEAINAWGTANGRIINVLLELHLGAEETKQGFSANEILDIVSREGTLSEIPGHPRPGKREGPKAARSAAPGRGREATVGDSVPVSGRVFEVDEFYGDNEGLVMAEIELENASDPFEKPSWLGQEVTGNRHYYNSYLSLHPYKTW